MSSTAAFAILFLGFVMWQGFRTNNIRLADEVIASHVRSLLATHLVDVPSSDQHTVKPWFNGKIDFAPEVKDLAAQGFPLVGGRLDYIGGKTAAALVYRRNQHPINVLVVSAPGKGDARPANMNRKGYHLIHWTRDGLDYWAVSDLNTTELGQFVSELAK
jgi:anti-sigma factor RsiW